MDAIGRISSEFNRLRDSSWLATAYTLGLCAAQPMVSAEAARGGEWAIITARQEIE